MPVVEYLGEEIEVRERAAQSGTEYSFRLSVPGTGEAARIAARISLEKDKTVVVVHAADVHECLRHRYADGSLCMWFEPDGPECRWVASDGLDALVAHIGRHLFQEAVCRVGDSWPGDESPVGSHPRPSRCKTCGGEGA